VTIYLGYVTSGLRRLGAGRLGAVLIKNRHGANGRAINEQNHSIAELET